MCWTMIAHANQTVVFRKPESEKCYEGRSPSAHPPLCALQSPPDLGWNTPMEACITPLPEGEGMRHRNGYCAPWLPGFLGFWAWSEEGEGGWGGGSASGCQESPRGQRYCRQEVA